MTPVAHLFTRPVRHIEPPPPPPPADEETKAERYRRIIRLSLQRVS